MATLLDLELHDALIRLDPALSLRCQELRVIYVFPRLAVWMAEKLPLLESTWNIEDCPIEQLDALIAQFCSGEALAYGQRFKPLNHLGDGIWELKTADLRMFGWFNKQDCFVATNCDLKRTIVESHLYRPYCEQAVRFRDQLELDEPKFITGDDPNVVVSDCYYP